MDMADEEVLRVAFERLRPVCVELTRSHTVECVEALGRVIAESDVKAISQLQEYILFPLRLLIKKSKNSSEKLYEKCVSLMTDVLSHGPVSQWSAFIDILSSLCCLISLPTAELTIAPVSEELKLSTVKCITTLLRRADNVLLLTLYRSDNLPLIGHLVSVLLALAQLEGNRKLNAAALKCLQLLMVSDRFQLNSPTKSSRGRPKTENQDDSGIGSDVSSNSDSNHLCNICNSKSGELESRLSSINLKSSELNTHEIQPSTDSDRDSKLSVMSNADSKDKSTDDIMFASSKIFASFLPGVLTAMSKLISGDSKRGHIVICGAVAVWSTVVTLVLGDESLSREERERVGRGVTRQEGATGGAQLGVNRTESWVETTVARVKLLVEKVVEVGCDDSWRIRKSVVSMAGRVILNCTRSLQNCVTLLLDVLVRGTTDEYDCVSRAAKSALEEFRRDRLEDETSKVIDLLMDCVYSLSTRLPRDMSSTSADDRKKLSTVRLLRGYFQLLGPRVNDLLMSEAHLHRLSGSLMQILQFDCSIIQLLEERAQGYAETTLADSRSVVAYRPRYHYRHFVDARVEQEVVALCGLLGQYADIDMLFDHFMDLYHRSEEYRKQAVFCMNALLSGLPSTAVSRCEACQSNVQSAFSSEQREMLIKALLDEYVSILHWPLHQATSSSTSTERISTELSPMTSLSTLSTAADPEEEEATINQRNSHILYTCLLLEGIGRCATVMGSDIDYMLSDTLYPVLAMLGCENARVSQCALLALHDVARAVNCASVSEVLCSNYDYVINAVSVKLRHAHHHPEALIVLSVLLRHGNTDVLPLVSDTMHEILEALDSHYDDMLLLFLRVFNSLVSSIFTWCCQVDNNVRTSESSLSSCPLSSAPLSSSDPSSSSSTSLSVGGPISSSPALESSDDIKANKSRDGTAVEPSTSDLVQYITEYHKNRLRGECFTDDDTKGDKEEEEVVGDTEHIEGLDDVGVAYDSVENKEEEKKLPVHAKLASQILERCQHLLVSQDLRIQLMVLDIIRQSCHILKPFQDELLPLVHQLWKPFVQRFGCGDAVIIVKAFSVLREIATCAGDFLYKRVISDVIPKVAQHLDKLSHASRRKESTYRHSAVCRLQLSLLQNVGSLCRSVMVDTKHMNDLMFACLPYLSCHQPSCLQQACIEAFTEFSLIDPDSVWLLLNDIYCPHNPLSTNISTLKHTQMSGTSSNSEYSCTIERLLELV